LDDKKAQQGIFYTPEGLANLLIENVITNEGKVLDPSCGSGIFLVLAFRKMYVCPDNITGTYDKIQHRLAFVKKNIFGIELENTAARLAMFSLYLEVLKDISTDELNQLVTELIRENSARTLFPIDFSENIQEQNALLESEKVAFIDEKFDYIIGNPPWFVIGKEPQNNNDTINYSYWNKYRDCFSRERQISQCFLHRIKYWSANDTKFGFIVNSSNFINESDNFQQFIFSSYRLQQIFELYHVKEILFDYAKEPACVLTFDNHISEQNSIEYFLPKLNSFAETFKTVILNQSDVIIIEQNDLLKQNIKLRDYLIGTENELLLANKLEQENASINDIMLVDKEYDSYRGFEDWGADALNKEFGKNKNKLSNADYDTYKKLFLDKYYSNAKDTEHTISFIKSAQLEKFKIKKTNTYCREDIANFHRARNNSVYEGEKILCSRVGGETIACYSNNKIYFDSNIYVIKLNDNDLYPIITAIINSDLAQYYWKVKSRKRMGSSFPKINSGDFLSLPVPKKLDINSEVMMQLHQLSSELTDGVYSFEEKKTELNELVFDLYELNYIESQRISDFFIAQNLKITKDMFEDYCDVFFRTIRRYLKTGIVKMEYSYNPNLPLDIAGVRITLGANSNVPDIKKVNTFINYQLLKQVGSSVLLSFNQRIYSEDSIFILKDTNPKSWTKSAAFDDAREEIEKFLQK
jgi:hypothetical protein